MKTSKRFLKKKILKIKYLEQEYDDSFETYQYAKNEFERVVRELHYNLNLPQDIFNQTDSSSTSTSDQNKDSLSESTSLPGEEMISQSQKKGKKHPEWVKKVFRKIVRITHPDKLPKDLNSDIRNSFIENYQRCHRSCR